MPAFFLDDTRDINGVHVWGLCRLVHNLVFMALKPLFGLFAGVLDKRHLRSEIWMVCPPMTPTQTRRGLW